MVFNSLEFLLFFPLTLLVFFLLKRWNSAQIIFLLFASCVFYMAFVPVYIVILFGTIIIDYFAGLILEKLEGWSRKAFLIISLITNIGVLFVFKYYNFFVDNIAHINSLLKLSWQPSHLSILLPIGLSFHTFQAMSYTIEVYRGNQKAERNFWIYSLYVMFFPQLVAGPIERPQNMLLQFHKSKSFKLALFWNGLELFLCGMLRKVLIADRLSVFVDTVYKNPTNLSSGATLMAAYFFSIQIYCDFAGYSDMARGLARMMGFELMTNFNSPYLSSSITEFWRRWHISLSTWFRDYLYFPLGGNRISHVRNILVVFLISGLWHGANWTFVAWGFIHGMAIAFETTIKKFKVHLPKFIKIIFVFQLVTIAWVFFRAPNFEVAHAFLKNLIQFKSGFLSEIHESTHGLGPVQLSFMLICISGMFFLEHLDSKFKLFTNRENYNSWLRIILFSFALGLLLIFGNFTSKEFIYFQF